MCEVYSMTSNKFSIAAWIVKDVTLFHTTAVFATTGERATMSNGSLAGSRVRFRFFIVNPSCMLALPLTSKLVAAQIINMARSPSANVYVYVKFATSVPYERIQIFEQALREFVKARPREWGNFAGFRATAVLADLGYIGTGSAMV